MNEADTCRKYIVPKLHDADWEDDFITEQLVLTPGRIVPVSDRHIRRDGLRPDYVLYIRQNIPIAVVEAKADYKKAGDGLQQAIEYAQMMGVQFAYASNGHEMGVWQLSRIALKAVLLLASFQLLRLIVTSLNQNGFTG